MSNAYWTVKSTQKFSRVKHAYIKTAKENASDYYTWGYSRFYRLWLKNPKQVLLWIYRYCCVLFQTCPLWYHVLDGAYQYPLWKTFKCVYRSNDAAVTSLQSLFAVDPIRKQITTLNLFTTARILSRPLVENWGASFSFL